MAATIERGLGVVFAKGRTVSVRRGFGNDFLKIYTYKTEIPSVCVSVCLFVIYLLAEVQPQLHIFGIGTKPNVLRTF